jgi:hypothetical protein
VDGGDKLKTVATESLLDYIKSVEDLSRQEGLFAAFDLKHDFPNEWYKATRPPPDATERLLSLNNLHDRLPMFTRGRSADKIQAKEVYLLTPAALSASDLLLAQATNEHTFGDGTPFAEGPPVGTMKSFTLKELNDFSVDTWQITIKDRDTPIEKLWMVTRYVLN